MTFQIGVQIAKILEYKPRTLELRHRHSAIKETETSSGLADLKEQDIKK